MTYGEGVKSDYPTAFQQYEKTAKQKHANANRTGQFLLQRLCS
jgi:TPR repeat protein